MKFRDQVVECRKLYTSLYYARKTLKSDGVALSKNLKSDFHELLYGRSYRRILQTILEIKNYNILARIWAKLTWRI